MATRDVVLSCKSKAKILKWHVKPGESVKKDKLLATYIFTEKVDQSNFIVQRKLKSKLDGKVIELIVNPNDEVKKGKAVARLQEEQCEHNMVMKDMCCDCGADLRKEPGVPGELSQPTPASVPVVHNIHELKVSMQEAERLAKQDEKQLLKAKKLVLVVDLDMTLIHTTVQLSAKQAKDVYSFTLPNHQYEYHTKLRPNAHKFLENISKYYELHIFTMGSRMYAHTIAKMLDPDGKHFAHRIRSRDEFINSFSKFHDLKALFPCGDHMVCIIDDREDVWNFAPNLIVVKPYKYFTGTDDVNDPFKDNGNKDEEKVKETGNESKDEKMFVPIPEEGDTATTSTAKETEIGEGDSKPLKENKDEKTNGSTVETEQSSSSSSKDGENSKANANKDPDDYLTYLGTILERIHKSFYDTLDAVKEKGGNAKKESEITRYCSFKTLNPDVRVIAPELRRQTLSDCNIVFTGVVPTNVPLEKSRPWRTAISLGARVTNNVVEAKKDVDSELITTHVVAARHGTQKAYKASKNPDKIKLVNPNWLWMANERWSWPDESLFRVPAYDGRPNSPANSKQGTPQQNSFEGSSKSSKISPLVHDGFELPGGYDPDCFLGGFSKGELDAMDKEVEDHMQSENEESSDEEMARSMSCGSSDQEQPSSSSSKQKNKENTTTEDPPSSGQKRKRKRHTTSKKEIKKLKDGDNGEKGKNKTTAEDGDSGTDNGDSSRSSSGSSDSDNNDKKSNSTNNSSSNSSSSTSSSSSDDSDDSDDDDELGSLLERRISESQTE